jgi:hypothetical protein
MQTPRELHRSLSQTINLVQIAIDRQSLVECWMQLV